MFCMLALWLGWVSQCAPCVTHVCIHGPGGGNCNRKGKKYQRFDIFVLFFFNTSLLLLIETKAPGSLNKLTCGHFSVISSHYCVCAGVFVQTHVCLNFVFAFFFFLVVIHLFLFFSLGRAQRCVIGLWQSAAASPRLPARKNWGTRVFERIGTSAHKQRTDIQSDTSAGWTPPSAL